MIAQHIADAAVTTVSAFVVAVVLVIGGTWMMDSSLGINVGDVLLHDAKFWIGIALLLVSVTALCALYPSIALSRIRPVEALGRDRGRQRFHYASRLVVGCQFAIASALLVTLLSVSLQNAGLRRAARENTTDPIVVITSDLEKARVPVERFRDRLRALPHVQEVTARAYIQGFAYQLPATPLPYVAGLAIMVTVVAMAVSVQTIRAARRNPASVLRHE